jgi:hypothetical protein
MAAGAAAVAARSVVAAAVQAVVAWLALKIPAAVVAAAGGTEPKTPAAAMAADRTAPKSPAAAGAGAMVLQTLAAHPADGRVATGDDRHRDHGAGVEETAAARDVAGAMKSAAVVAAMPRAAQGDGLAADGAARNGVGADASRAGDCSTRDRCRNAAPNRPGDRDRDIAATSRNSSAAGRSSLARGRRRAAQTGRNSHPMELARIR